MAELIAEDFLKKLTKAWRGKIELATQARQPWLDVRQQCMTFVSGGAGEFWADSFQNKFLGTTIPAKFKITMNKAFELIAIMGPVIFSRNPMRDVYPPDPIDVDIELLGDPQDPNVQAAYGQLMMTQRTEQARNRTRCALAERYLNYTAVEQPDGGLQSAGTDGVTDAMIGGLGLLWPQAYSMPGSERKLTGCFFDSSENLLMDPDVRDMRFGRAKWCARSHVDARWEVERRFKLPNDALKDYSWRESASAQAERKARDLKHLDHSRGQTHDLVKWWEIWSTGGVGSRLSGADESLRTAFDEYVGDYAYLATTEGEYPFPLNCPVEALRTESVEEIQRRFRWPIPFWQDRRWPFAPLRFYKHPDHLYPLGPLTPGLGELTFLNLILSRTANHVWQSTKQFIAVVESAKKDLENVLRKGEDLAIFPVKDIHRNLKQLVDFLQYPNISTDLWTMVSLVSETFDKRVGLTELMYALSRTASRTATDVQAKEEKLSIRPDYMSGCVEDWLSEASAMEKLCAYWSGVSGQDVSPLLGTVGSSLWDELFVNVPPEVVAREMYCRVAAGSARKRNRAQELMSLREFYGPMSQQLGAYAGSTGDTKQLNELNRKVFDAMNLDDSGLELGPWAPPPPPPEADPQALAEAELQGKLELEAAEQQAQLGMEAESHIQDLTHEEEKHDQEMLHKAEEGELDRRLKIALAAAQTQIARVKAKTKTPARKAG